MDHRQPSSTALPQDLTTAVRSVDHRTMVVVQGDLDLHGAPVLRETLSALAHRGHDHLVLVLDEVAFIDSIGLGVLVAGLKQLRSRNGDLQLVCSHDRVLRIFELTGLTGEFVIHRTESAALQVG